ncbi:MAG TPA: hypothetical protein PLR32_01520 [candidate division Zixibacteria bacterium]|nr:hypothetical protein [candidate division Zixibacteria bacterium]HOE28042.1 hypothetical protein [bacterium]MDD4916213.1 hypothetical protein [candidate division Zixibacteria bacterium]MDM7972733.1 hypothetical protein [candidate division Zixibacteria bacterium]HOZ08705.1 hypothetical protein [candidate division Zixibacteria bacterium]
MKLLFVALVVATLLAAFYYFFVDTLTLTEIASSSGNRTAAAAAALVNFDTGLTRWDIRRLSDRASAWEERWRALDSLSDRSARRAGRDSLVSEMMADPAFKKLSDRLGTLGERSAESILEFLSRR